jgi:hypothetical protein
MSTTLTVKVEDPTGPGPAFTTPQRHEAERIAHRYGRTEVRLRRNGIAVVYVFGDQPEVAFVQRGAQYQRLQWPHTVVALAPDGSPVWSMNPPVPSMPTTEVTF